MLLLSRSSGRDILYGISARIRQRRFGWRLHPINFDGERSDAELRGALEAGADGVISNIDPKTMATLGASRLPVVVVGAPIPEMSVQERSVAFVHGDERAIGKLGAQHLASLGRFRAFGFVKANDAFTPTERAEGFRAWISARGGGAAVSEYMPEGTADADGARLSGWLRSLPRPAAVMVSSDPMAVQVLEAAARAEIKVPREMVVLGVDNDELLCETSVPSLSSVALDHAKMGGNAVDAMARLLDVPDSGPFTLMTPAMRIVDRESTRPPVPSAAVAERALAFIRRNALSGIGVADVVEHLGVSRSLADLRVRQATGESILDAIHAVRLDALMAKLRGSGLSVAQAARSCGFGTAIHAERLFRRRFGTTMSAARKAAKS